MVYFRSAYSPDSFPSEKEWAAREMIEVSRAVKCPNIDFHISGCKKFQQCLSTDLPRFTDNPEEITRNITEIYDFSEISEEIVERVKESPKDWVLKPQREGGGNNTYGADILQYLENRRSHKEFILMKMIHCQEHDVWMVRNGVVRLTKAISEVGMFGRLVCKGNEVYLNDYAGYLVRTKSADSNEGGVAAGYAVLDSASLT